MRTSILKSYHVWHLTLTFAALIFGASIVAFADSTPLQLTWQNLKNDVSLGKQITLEAKHLPLDTLLAQVSEQSGVKISLPPNSNLSLKLVTARISQMNLYDFMGAIGRTYNGSWSKGSDGTFMLISQNGDAIEEGISQMGTPVFFQYRDRLLPSDAEKNAGR